MIATPNSAAPKATNDVAPNELTKDEIRAALESLEIHGIEELVKDGHHDVEAECLVRIRIHISQNAIISRLLDALKPKPNPIFAREQPTLPEIEQYLKPFLQIASDVNPDELSRRLAFSPGRRSDKRTLERAAIMIPSSVQAILVALKIEKSRPAGPKPNGRDAMIGWLADIWKIVTGHYPASPTGGRPAGRENSPFARWVWALAEGQAPELRASLIGSAPVGQSLRKLAGLGHLGVQNYKPGRGHGPRLKSKSSKSRPKRKN